MVASATAAAAIAIDVAVAAAAAVTMLVDDSWYSPEAVDAGVAAAVVVAVDCCLSPVFILLVFIALEID